MKTICALFVILATVLTCSAQTQSAFDVAVVRVAHGNPKEGHWSPPGSGRFFAHDVTLARLLILAYGVNEEQIANRPSWLDTDLFEVDARPSAGIALNREELKPMLQALLAERFHLAVHTEQRPVPGYALIVASRGARLHPTKGAPFPGFRTHTDNGMLSGMDWSMPFLASVLQKVSGRPVVDQTGIAGGYDVQLEFAPDLSTESTLPSLFTALEETLGLKLKPEKIPIEFVVIDHVDRAPIEN